VTKIAATATASVRPGQIKPAELAAKLAAELAAKLAAEQEAELAAKSIYETFVDSERTVTRGGTTYTMKTAVSPRRVRGRDRLY
jgi:hypothetical protein